MPACTHTEDCKSGKSANKNHFYEMVEGGKSPLSVSLVTVGFDLIVPSSLEAGIKGLQGCTAAIKETLLVRNLI